MIEGGHLEVVLPDPIGFGQRIPDILDVLTPVMIGLRLREHPVPLEKALVNLTPSFASWSITGVLARFHSNL
nr:hypothetical protein [Pricia antarctica]